MGRPLSTREALTHPTYLLKWQEEAVICRLAEAAGTFSHSLRVVWATKKVPHSQEVLTGGLSERSSGEGPHEKVLSTSQRRSLLSHSSKWLSD